MLETQRHSLILDLLDERSVMTVQELTEALLSSEATIRRDLKKLSDKGLLIKIHGGAERKGSPKVPRPHLAGSAFLVDMGRNVEAKRAIASRAVALCDDGDAITINGGSSTYMMTEYLVDRQLNILTNSVPLALELLNTSDNRVSLPGGELYRKQNIILSAFDNDIIENYHSRMMFMGTPGIGDYGLMESDPLLVRAELKLKKQAEKLVVLADSSKIGARSNLIVAPLEEVDILITDKGIQKKDLAMFRKAGIEVIVV